jgi:hypothetical protein
MDTGALPLTVVLMTKAGRDKGFVAAALAIGSPARRRQLHVPLGAPEPEQRECGQHGDREHDGGDAVLMARDEEKHGVDGRHSPEHEAADAKDVHPPGLDP